MSEPAGSRARQALVGLGSNLGDRQATLAGAIAALGGTPGIAVVACSRVFETAPVGFTEQPRFLNMAVGIETLLTPEALLSALQAIEQRFGRTRSVRWGPRTLDLDLLAYEDEIRTSTVLTLPHPRLLGRAFVTIPLREILRAGGFSRPAWDALRSRIGALPAESADVAVFAERP